MESIYSIPQVHATVMATLQISTRGSSKCDQYRYESLPYE